MEKIIEKLFDIEKIPTKFIFVLWLASSFILFTPQNFLTKLNMKDFNSEYGKYLGITFIICSAFLFVIVANFLIKKINHKADKRKTEESISNAVNRLDNHEKALLREFFIQGKNTLQLPIDNDTVAGLFSKGVIYQVSNTGFTYLHGAYFTYSISAYAHRLLTYQILELPKKPTEQEKVMLFEKRPQWAKDKSRMDDIHNALRF